MGLGCKNDYGLQRELHIESFLQPLRAGGVDILWVVDDSASMYEEQAQLEAHAAHFTDILSAVPVDFRLAVASTDVSDPGRAGRLLGPVLTPETPLLSDAFAAQVTHHSDGSREEHGFDAALLAAEPGGLGGPSFARREADLEVVFFSDEDDGSALTSEALLDGLSADRQGAVVLSAVVGDPPEGCVSLEAAADAGVKYIDVQEQSGGLRESICALDYGAMLERVAVQVLGMARVFSLPKIPEPSTMEVRVDGVLIPSRERHGWRYDPGENAVVFDGYAVPRPGAAIVVRYYDWLGPSAALLEEEDDHAAP